MLAYILLEIISIIVIIIAGTKATMSLVEYFIDKDGEFPIIEILIIIIAIITMGFNNSQMQETMIQRNMSLWNNGKCIHDDTDLKFVNSSSDRSWSYVTYECPECGYIIKLIDFDNQAWSTVHN